MYKEQTFLAIVPARGGSKGLPGKNIKKLCGKPLIAWSIEAGFKSKYLDELMVSTDSDDIADIARQYGANVPYCRPKHLAADSSTTLETIKNVIEIYKNKLNKEFDYVVLLEPTSPLREAYDIDKAIELLLNSTADSIVGISRTEVQNPEFLIHLNKNNFISGYENENMNVLRRQDIKDVYFFDGTIYISKIDVLFRKESFYHNNTMGYEVPKYKSLEIDDLNDFIMVEAIMNHKGYSC